MAKIIIDIKKCKGCFLCIEACPKRSIKKDEKITVRGNNPVKFSEGSECIGCALCAIVCPDCCIEVYK